MRTLILLTILTILGGCTAIPKSVPIGEPPSVQSSPIPLQMSAVPPIDGAKITIAVYQFMDKTGQRKPADNIANLSSAVTQGAEVWVIKALQEVGNESWFTVVERAGLDNLVKERQLIKSTREVYEGKEAIKLKPLMFAGLLLEGGVVGYESNIESGGVGARYFGIGANTQYRVDQVTIAMRIVSVQTGEVLLTTATEKRIASHKSGADVFRFLDLGTKALELEAGSAVNEPVNYAVRTAIEAGVVDLIHQGEAKGLWKYSDKLYNQETNKQKESEDE